MTRIGRGAAWGTGQTESLESFNIMCGRLAVLLIVSIAASCNVACAFTFSSDWKDRWECGGWRPGGRSPIVNYFQHRLVLEGEYLRFSDLYWLFNALCDTEESLRWTDNAIEAQLVLEDGKLSFKSSPRKREGVGGIYEPIRLEGLTQIPPSLKDQWELAYLRGWSITQLPRDNRLRLQRTCGTVGNFSRGWSGRVLTE